MKNDNHKLDYTLLLFLAALFLFNSPFFGWWSQLHLPWYTIFLVWLAVIAMVAVNHHRSNTDDRD